MRLEPSRDLPHRSRPKRWRHWRVGGALLLAFCAGGCAQAPRVSVDWRSGPFFAPTNFQGVAEMPADVRRVAVLPIVGLPNLPAESLESLEAAARAALLAEARFETVPITPELLRSLTGRSVVAAGDALPAGLLERIGRELAADAVLFLEITAYRPYTPLELGIRAKLARCDQGQSLLWAFDTFYTTRDPAVANSARRFTSGGKLAPVDLGPAALQSPSRFSAYVFADAFATIPPRPAPVPAGGPPKVLRHRAD